MRIDFHFEIAILLLLTAGGSLWAGQTPPRSPAQDNSGYKFQPPRPPPLDGENFDDDDDAMELGDEGFRPPPAPPAPGAGGGMNNGGSNPGFNPNDSRPQASNFGNTNTSPKKFRFQVVPDEYWEKGKKRVRGNQVHVTGSDEK